MVASSIISCGQIMHGARHPIALLKAIFATTVSASYWMQFLIEVVVNASFMINFLFSNAANCMFYATVLTIGSAENKYESCLLQLEGTELLTNMDEEKNLQKVNPSCL